MALELRPNCEGCDKDLPPDAIDACICTYECTFCADCVENLFHNVCPNCGGGFMPRPIRPKTAWRERVSLSYQPASTKRRILKYVMSDIKAHIDRIKNIPPEER